MSPPNASSSTAMAAPPCVTPEADGSQWFRDEVHPHDSKLRSYLRRSFPSVQDVDDVIQESYLKIWKARAGGPVRSAKAFLFTIARRVAVDSVRRTLRSPFVPVKDVNRMFVLDTAPDAGQVVNRALEIQLLAEAVESLPGRCREVFILCHVEGLSQREAAAKLGIAEGTVAVQASRGLLRCGDHIRKRMKLR